MTQRNNDLPPDGHEPVMVSEVLDLLDPRPGETIVDCTLGRGGHSLRIAERLGPDGLLIGLDADPRNLDAATARLDAADLPCRRHLVHANFAELSSVLRDLDLGGVDGLLADFGVSTNQLLTGDYGLSFSGADAPLDMRLDPRLRESASDIVARWPEKKIADTIYGFAQERFSRRIARKIVERRRERPISTTGDLADLVRRCVPRSRGSNVDPATRTFMALRMAVNREVDVLEKLLAGVPDVLEPGGRGVFISFHSGEDRVVKNALREAASLGRLELLTKKPLEPSENEVERNPRARSAKLRAARRPDP